MAPPTPPPGSFPRPGPGLEALHAKGTAHANGAASTQELTASPSRIAAPVLSIFDGIMRAAESDRYILYCILIEYGGKRDIDSLLRQARWMHATPDSAKTATRS